MRHYSLDAIEKLQNLHSFLFPDGNTFYPEKMILDLGLYESLLIDTSDIKIDYSYLQSENKKDNTEEIVSNVEVSKDVKALHSFISYSNSLLLPCPECNKTLAFTPKSKNKRIKNKNRENNKGEFVRVNVGHESVTLSYAFGRNDFEIIGCNLTNINTNSGIESCVKGILDNVSVFQKHFYCSLEPKHNHFIDCVIHRAIDVCKKPKELLEFEKRKSIDSSIQMDDKEKELFEKFNNLYNVLILEKVGQEPSMADLQMFDIEKYKSILSKERFKDFSMALGLYASGVGCGSLLYLRRIFESIVINVQIECEKRIEWDKALYESKRFNEKIEYLEELGEKIVPDELSEVKTKIYGFF